jgi:hypothetical protein
MPVTIHSRNREDDSTLDVAEGELLAQLPGFAKVTDGGDGEIEVVSCTLRRGPHDDWLLVARVRFSDPESVGAASYDDPSNCYVAYSGGASTLRCLAKFEAEYAAGTLKLFPDKYAQAPSGNKTRRAGRK